MRDKETGAYAPLKFILFSFFGLCMFFFPIEWLPYGHKGVPIDFIAHLIQTNYLPVTRIFILAMIYAGIIMPIVQKTWCKSSVNILLYIIKFIGAILGTILYFGLCQNNSWLWKDSTGPFVFDRLAAHTGLLIPIVSLFLVFLSNFGLPEFIGTLLDRGMRVAFDIPGEAAVNAVASLYGSYPSAFIITNSGYRSGRYTTREAAIIATGFSTVSVASIFAISVALGFVDKNPLYLFFSIPVTLLTTAFTARLWPLYYLPDRYFEGRITPLFKFSGGCLARAWKAATFTADRQENILKLCKDNLISGFKIAFGVLPLIISLSILGFWFADFTPFGTWIGYLFYPLFRAFGIAQPELASKAAALTLPDMSIPIIMMKSTGTTFLKFVIAIVSISETLFFSASIPCLIVSDIPLKISHIIVIWFERVVISILITVPLGLLMNLSDAV